MGRLPTVLASSVIRGTQLGESHGGLYLVDLDRGLATLKVDWDTAGIDISGRGGDRGLRGIAYFGQHILVAANSELLVLNQDFAVIESFTNPYLRHCHEISVANDLVFLTATGFDSVLTFDLGKKRFTGGWNLFTLGDSLQLRPFDPSTTAGPAPTHRFHLNSVSACATGMWFSGLYTPGLLYTDGNTLTMAAPLPPGTHNAQMLGDGVLFNDTAADRLCYARNGTLMQFAVPDFDAAELSGLSASDVARPRFARGLCVGNDGLVAGGSSPSTVSLYDLRNGVRVMQHTLSMDVRNALHGLALWPY